MHPKGGKGGRVETKKTGEAEYTCAQGHVRTAGLNGAAGLFGGKLTELCANRQDGYAEGGSLDGQIPIMEVLKTIVRAAQVGTLSGGTLRLTLSPPLITPFLVQAVEAKGDDHKARIPRQARDGSLIKRNRWVFCDLGAGIGIPGFAAQLLGFVLYQYEIDAQNNEHQMKLRLRPG